MSRKVEGGSAIPVYLVDSNGNAIDYLPLSGGTMSGIIINPILRGSGESVNALGNVSGAVIVDVSLGNVVTMTAIGTITSITFTNSQSSGVASGLVLMIKQGGSGSYTVTTWTNVSWGDVGTPILSTAVGDIDVFILYTVNGGTNWAGFISGTGFTGLF